MKVFFLLLLGALFGVAFLPYLLFRQKPMPEGTHLASPAYPVREARLLIDRTTWDRAAGAPVREHEIFDGVLEEIRAAERFLIVDFFLWNPWLGGLESGGALRPLARELADALLAKRRQEPDLPILVITDPINRIYGDQQPAFYDELAAAGIPVVFTALQKLPDSNRLYAPQAWFWKKFLPSPVPGEGRRIVPNPFDPEGAKLTLPQLGRLLYFKANHRKVLIAGRSDGANRLLVPSFNPADGSANHANIGLLVAGPVADFAARSELAIAAWSAAEPGQVHGGLTTELAAAVAAIRDRLEDGAAPVPAPGQPTAAYRSERAIRDELLRQMEQAVTGTRIDIGLFYFSDRGVVKALKAAIKRGATTRVLLDANHDAFGREKNGIPNRTVAAELMELTGTHSIELRWAATRGEQFHSKVLRVAGPEQNILFLGSANWTRRNLDNLNLEANLLLRDHPRILSRFDAYFESVWQNSSERDASLPYAAHAEKGWSLTWKTWLYRFQEWSGASTF